MRGSFGSTTMGLPTLKRLTEVVVEGGGQLSVVRLGHPKLKNDLRRHLYR
jgi:type II secretory pathway predicted ATPase ExeA